MFVRGDGAPGGGGGRTGGKRGDNGGETSDGGGRSEVANEGRAETEETGLEVAEELPGRELLEEERAFAGSCSLAAWTERRAASHERSSATSLAFIRKTLSLDSSAAPPESVYETGAIKKKKTRID